MVAIESLITSNRQQSPGQPSGFNEAVCPPPSGHLLQASEHNLIKVKNMHYWIVTLVCAQCWTGYWVQNGQS